MKKFKSILNRIIDIMPIVSLMLSAFTAGAYWEAVIMSNNDTFYLVSAILASIVMILSVILMIIDVIELNRLFDENV